LTAPGLLALLGSGETTPVGGQVFEAVAKELSRPYQVAILETPAGFELNSAAVAGRVRQYLEKRLQNDSPSFDVIPARKKGTPFSPDDPELARRLLAADILFLGPGSPTYAVRQLKDSRVWAMLRAHHSLGVPVVTSSAAAIAMGRLALPVYEIYKAGEDPHWKEGLDFLGGLGLDLVIVPHWNNSEGGAELDTRRCFLGLERFTTLASRVNPGSTILGIDENTALVIDFVQENCQVIGNGHVSIIKQDQDLTFARGDPLPLSALGSYRPAPIADLLPDGIWEEAVAARAAQQALKAAPKEVPAEVLALSERRQAARAVSDWAEADRLRGEIQVLGWTVSDTPEGQRFDKKGFSQAGDGG
jgi:hypothetical protein